MGKGREGGREGERKQERQSAGERKSRGLPRLADLRAARAGSVRAAPRRGAPEFAQRPAALRPIFRWLPDGMHGGAQFSVSAGSACVVCAIWSASFRSA